MTGTRLQFLMITKSAYCCITVLVRMAVSCPTYGPRSGTICMQVGRHADVRLVMTQLGAMIIEYHFSESAYR